MGKTGDVFGEIGGKVEKASDSYYLTTQYERGENQEGKWKINRKAKKKVKMRVKMRKKVRRKLS